MHMEGNGDRNGNDNGNGNGDDVSASSSPPTPPSPLPISVGPGNQKYLFSPSPSPSPPFSPPGSSHSSTENLPLLHDNKPAATSTTPAVQARSTFSLERRSTPINIDQELHSDSSSCLQVLIEWFVEKCCCWCFKSLFPQLNTMHARKD